MSSEAITLHHGDSRDVLKTMADASVDSVVTDPPYALAFMGKAWDTSETAFDPDFWREVMRVLKPGGHVIAASGTRTYHRLAVAIEDAGFEIRDMVSWLYGSGFPKSHNQPGGWGTALKPACEPWVLARKPLIGTVAANVLAHGTGAINIDGCRVPGGERPTTTGGMAAKANPVYGTFGREQIDHVMTTEGRWPANVIHDGSDEVVAGFPQTTSGKMQPTHTTAARAIYGQDRDGGFTTMETYGDSGSAARFFYSAKASKADRAGSKHPTVKPIALMRYLCRLITPPGGTILDPFAGSGTTGEAARLEGFRAILIEREDEYAADIRNRMAAQVPDLLEALL